MRSFKLLVKPLIIILAILAIVLTPSNASAASSLYEYLNTGGDGDSNWTYSNNWTSQSFTIGTQSHTITSIRVPLKRVGTNPGTITLSLRATSSSLPTGVDLASATIVGTSLTTAYTWQVFDIDDYGVEAGVVYSIVLRATSGDTSNYVLWQKDTGGGLASAIACNSQNGGVSWASVAPSDQLFEVYGESSIQIQDVEIFTNYLQTGDWLICAKVQNTYKPYYPNTDPAKSFRLQLVSNITVKAATPFVTWDRQPLAIYINADLASSMSWSSNTTYVRIQSVNTSAVYTDYTVLPADWNSGSLDSLDSWVRLTAKDLQTYYNTALLVNTATKGEVLNQDGGVIFLRGIPLLSTVRPNIFQMAVSTVNPSVTTFTHAGETAKDLATSVGPKVYGALDDAGNILGVDAIDIAQWFLIGIWLIAGLFLASRGSGIVGAFLGFPVIGIAIWIGAISLSFIAVVAGVLIIIFVVNTFFK